MTPQKAPQIPNWTILRHMAVATPNGQADLVLYKDDTHHLIQIVGGKWSTIKNGESALAAYESILSKAPGACEF